MKEKEKYAAQAAKAAIARVLDNQKVALAHYLRGKLPNTETLRLVSAYFSVYGYEGLAKELDEVGEIKFLSGDPNFTAEVIVGGKKHRRFELSNEELSSEVYSAESMSTEDTMRQREWAKRCAKWIEEKVEVRTIKKTNFMHGKMWHLHLDDGETAATLGSSNFTRRGLGLAQNYNLELNISVEERATRDKLAEWFDEIWNDENLTKDAKDDLLAALNRVYKEYSPSEVYYKTLFELFHPDLERHQADEDRFKTSHLYDSEIWNKLYEFQKDGAKHLIARLMLHGGCILADSVGLGKTYTALAVIKFFELRNERVLVLCPKKLENNWRIYKASAFSKSNPFSNDRFAYMQLAHTDLSREGGMAGDVDLEDITWSSFDLVVIDESHNFRNESKITQDERGNFVSSGRYSKLLQKVIKEGGKTKVLMLSATPVNTSLIDLRNQIYLMTERKDDAFAETLGISHIGNVMRVAQKKFLEWEKEGRRKKSNLMESLSGDFLHLVGGVTIARSRKQINRFYREHIEKYGDFPKRKKPRNETPHTDTESKLSYEHMHELISRIKFSVYRPSEHVIAVGGDNMHNKKKQWESSLVSMMRINFLKRLESSACALRESLCHIIEKVKTQIEKIERFSIDAKTVIDLPEHEDEDDEDFVVSKARYSYKLSELKIKEWRDEMKEDLVFLQEVYNVVAQITPERDNKLRCLMNEICAKSKKANKKLLVFTTFKDTAIYLYEHVSKEAERLGVRIAVVTGDNKHNDTYPHATYGKDFMEILNNFSPETRGRSGGTGEIDILIATDCISEGQNLQDCDTVLNYDIHWNPVRIIQRFGRIDRIGSKNDSVGMINFWPTEDMDLYLNLENRVRARMALVDIAATGDEDGLNEEGSELAIKGELNHRDEQIRQMRKGGEILNLEDLQDSVSISDFTLDYFYSQLARYLEKHKDALESMPSGVYAVAGSASGNLNDTSRSEAVFFFRQKAKDKNRVQNPTHPFFFVHVRKDGLQHGYTKAGTILALFEELAEKENKPLGKLCDLFSQEMETPEGKARYDNLARIAQDHIKSAFAKNAMDGLSVRSYNVHNAIPLKERQPMPANLELVTWLVVKNKPE